MLIQNGDVVAFQRLHALLKVAPIELCKVPRDVLHDRESELGKWASRDDIVRWVDRNHDEVLLEGLARQEVVILVGPSGPVAHITSECEPREPATALRVVRCPR